MAYEAFETVWDVQVLNSGLNTNEKVPMSPPAVTVPVVVDGTDPVLTHVVDATRLSGAVSHAPCPSKVSVKPKVSTALVSIVVLVVKPNELMPMAANQSAEAAIGTSTTRPTLASVVVVTRLKATLTPMPRPRMSGSLKAKLTGSIRLPTD